MIGRRILLSNHVSCPGSKFKIPKIRNKYSEVDKSKKMSRKKLFLSKSYLQTLS